MEFMKYTNIKDELTIVIPCFNEVNYIGKTLESLQRQIGIVGTRVIICDNDSTDGTIHEISRYKEKLKNYLKIELQDGGKVAKARNVGARLSTTQYILFLDADSTLTSPKQIRNCVYKMNEGYSLVTCKVKSISPSLRSKLSFKLFNLVNYFVSMKTPFAVGTFFLTTRVDFFNYGQFDENLQHSEDYCLSKKYSVNKFKIMNYHVGQDDRRFKKMGYVGMIRLLVKSFINRNNINYFREDIGYWK